MIVVLLAVRLPGLEERRHGAWVANWQAYRAMSKASVPNPSIRGSEKDGGQVEPRSSDEVAPLSARPLGVERTWCARSTTAVKRSPATPSREK